MDLMTVAALALFGTWAANRGLDYVLTKLTSRRKSIQKEMITAVNSALASDATLAKRCDDVSKVATEVARLLEDASLLQACVANDPQALIQHIQGVQGFSLPGFSGTEEEATSLLRGAGGSVEADETKVTGGPLFSPIITLRSPGGWLCARPSASSITRIHGVSVAGSLSRIRE